jgi:Phospholipase_D-nuclease N-terminal
MLADYDFGDFLWTTLVFFFWFMLIWMFIMVFADIFRRKDLSGGAKAGWVLLIFILPLIGILIYLIARPSIVDAREMSSASAGQAQGSAGYASPDHFA